MVTAEGHMATDRAGRYLEQLCQHLDSLGQARPQMRVNVEWSGEHGVIDFGWGRCTLDAKPSALGLVVQAGDEPSLRELQQRISDRLERIGRRDGLRVTWSPVHGTAVQMPGPPPGGVHHHMKGHRDD
jgi:hypothetical protein